MYFNVSVCWLFVVHGTLFTSYVVSWILSYACDFHASNIVEQSFDFEIRSKNEVLGLQCASPVGGWVCCNLFKWHSPTCGWMGMLHT
jgi:hypothetical protein